MLLLDGAESMCPLASGVQALLAIAQQLAQAHSSSSVLVLTSGVQLAVPLGAPGPASSASSGGAWGFSRVMRLEVPSVPLLSADVLPGPGSVEASGALVGSGWSEGHVDSERELSWHGGGWHAPRLRSVHDAASSAGTPVARTLRE